MPERIALYCRGLNDIGEKQLIFAFDKALHNLGEFLPSIEQLHAWAEDWQAVDPIAETRKLLEREDKPSDWAPIGNTEATLRALAKQQGGVSQEEITYWLDGGKRAQQERIARIIQDLKWQEAAGRAGVPGFREFVEGLAATRNGPTKVPKDSGERAVWARQMARKQGWIEGERQPGEEG
jgi:hypothetical protein